MVKYFVVILTSLMVNAVTAVPIVNLTNSDDSSQQALVQSNNNDAWKNVDTSSMSDDQRIARLEQLVNAQGQMQVMQRVQQLQQQIELLQGQNEVLKYELKQQELRQHYLFQQLSKGDKVKMPDEESTLNNSGAADLMAYQKAYSLIAQRDYSGAVKSLQQFIEKYPRSQYIPDALYWQGEVLSVQGKNNRAESVLQQLIQRFPQSHRISDAKLKLATIAMNQDNTRLARQLFQDIIKNHPNSAAASIAVNKMRLLKD